MQPRALLHITSSADWAAATTSGRYRAASLDTEGFIHLSLERQWLATASRFFHGTAGLVLLVIRPDRLTAPVRLEPAHGDSFPHLYGELTVAAVVRVLPLFLSPAGDVLPPADLAEAIAESER